MSDLKKALRERMDEQTSTLYEGARKGSFSVTGPDGEPISVSNLAEAREAAKRGASGRIPVFIKGVLNTVDVADFAGVSDDKFLNLATGEGVAQKLIEATYKAGVRREGERGFLDVAGDAFVETVDPTTILRDRSDQEQLSAQQSTEANPGATFTGIAGGAIAGSLVGGAALAPLKAAGLGTRASQVANGMKELAIAAKTEHAASYLTNTEMSAEMIAADLVGVWGLGKVGKILKRRKGVTRQARLAADEAVKVETEVLQQASKATKASLDDISKLQTSLQAAGKVVRAAGLDDTTINMFAREGVEASIKASRSAFNKNLGSMRGSAKQAINLDPVSPISSRMYSNTKGALDNAHSVGQKRALDELREISLAAPTSSMRKSIQGHIRALDGAMAPKDVHKALHKATSELGDTGLPVNVLEDIAFDSRYFGDAGNVLKGQISALRAYKKAQQSVSKLSPRTTSAELMKVQQEIGSAKREIAKLTTKPQALAKAEGNLNKWGISASELYGTAEAPGYLRYAQRLDDVKDTVNKAIGQFEVPKIKAKGGRGLVTGAADDVLRRVPGLGIVWSVLSNASRKIGTGSKRAAGVLSKGIFQSPLGPGALRGSHLFLKRKDKDQLFEELRAGISGEVMNPQVLVDTITEQEEALDEVGLELKSKASFRSGYATMYLYRHLPKKLDVSAMEKDTFLSRVDVVMDPTLLLDHAATGTLTPEMTDAVREVYPSIYADMVVGVMEELKVDLPSLPMQSKQVLKTLTGVALDPLLTPEYGAIMYNNGAQTPTQDALINGRGNNPQRQYQNNQNLQTAANRLGGK